LLEGLDEVLAKKIWKKFFFSLFEKLRPFLLLRFMSFGKLNENFLWIFLTF
jgi:hypothetical protein